MTKPLTIFLEFSGGILLLVGMVEPSMSLALLGGALLIAGALGHRSRES